MATHKTKRFNRVVIAGMGLMGGSLGRTLIRKRLAKEVVGLGRNIKRLRIAKRKKAATSVTINTKDALKGADLIIIALPVNKIVGQFKRIQPFIEKGCIVTDMGSVKKEIIDKIRKTDKNDRFVGSHPMVGSEKTGVENIMDNLYSNGTCIVTVKGKNPKKPNSKEGKIIRFWKNVGMKVLTMRPDLHDKYVSGISHLPHLLSFVLVNAVNKVIKKEPKGIGSGFRDSTRIAGAGEEIWSAILIQNRNQVINDIKNIEEELKKIRKIIQIRDKGKLMSYIKKARLIRESIEK